MTTAHPRLRLVPHHVRSDDYLVMSGDEQVGRIYKRVAPEVEWLWAISLARYADWADLQLAGRTSSCEKAKRELRNNWTRVRAAGLSTSQEANQRRLKGDKITNTTTTKPTNISR